MKALLATIIASMVGAPGAYLGGSYQTAAIDPMTTGSIDRELRRMQIQRPYNDDCREWLPRG